MTAGVLYIANSARIGGGNRVLMDLIAGLDRSRFRPQLVIPFAGSLGEWARREGVECQVIPDGDWHGRVGLARRTTRLASAIVRSRARIVHANSHTCYRAAGLAGALTGAARVCHLGFPPELDELRWSFRYGPELVIGCHNQQANEVGAQPPIVRFTRACRRRPQRDRSRSLFAAPGVVPEARMVSRWTDGADGRSPERGEGVSGAARRGRANRRRRRAVHVPADWRRDELGGLRRVSRELHGGPWACRIACAFSAGETTSPTRCARRTSSCCRRWRRGSRWRSSKRWRAAVRSSDPRSAAFRKRFATA